MTAQTRPINSPEALWALPAAQQTRLASDFAVRVVGQQPEAVLADFAQDQFLGPLSRAHLVARVAHVLHGLSEESAWMAALRRLRNRLQLRWIWQDANGLTDVVQLTRELSDFADVCIEAAVAFARGPLVARHGEPIGENGQVQELIVMAMGKHGAQELNLSSDIDLIFCFDENGETQPSPPARRSIAVQQFMIQWGQAVIRLLDTVTADGFVFRVDMRLRPWGDGSPLAISYLALERYLEQHGREWERYAWIKARVVTGGAAGDSLLEMTRPFVYRRYVDYGAFAALREMKAMIEREVLRRNVAQDVKLGAGGIREVEFIVQAFQLLYGGSRRELRQRPCLVVLAELGRQGLLQAEQVAALAAAYRFLRRVEHAIQALEDQQTQQLPADPARLLRMVQVLGFAGLEDFEQALGQHRQVVRAEFAKVIVDRQRQEAQPGAAQPVERLHERLDAEGLARLEAFWGSRTIQKLPETALQRLRGVWPLLAAAILRQNDPQRALLRVIPLLETVARRSVYLVMLMENPTALAHLVQMMAVSPWISEELVRYPVLLDEFLSANLRDLPDRAQLADSLRQQLLRVDRDDTEGQMRVLRLFKKSQVLEVAASDVLAERPLMKVSDALTWIAEVVLSAALDLALAALVHRHGLPRCSNGERVTLDAPAFAIIGYGKLGGIELGYGSDLDLVFLHDVDEQAETDGGKPISGMEFCARLAQKVMSLLTTQTLDGRTYEIDTRLRPSGHAGLLVASVAAFRRYQEKNAWLWEHQALVRARGLCGGTPVLAAFEQVRLDTLRQVRDPVQVRQEVQAMRQKMRDHLGSSASEQASGTFHLKHDRGGIVDIEFIVQYGVLAFAALHPALAVWSDNVRLLDSMAQAGLLSDVDAEALKQAYLLERAATHRLALAQQPLRVPAQDWAQTRERVQGIWQQLLGALV